MDARWLCRCQWPTGFSSRFCIPSVLGSPCQCSLTASPARSGHSPTGAPGGPRGVSGRQGAHGRPGPVLPARTFCLSLSGCSTRAVWGPRVSVWRGDGPSVVPSGLGAVLAPGAPRGAGALLGWARGGVRPRTGPPVPGPITRGVCGDGAGRRPWTSAPPPQAPPRGRGAACVPRHRSAARRRRAAWSKWSRRSHPGRQASGPRLPAPLGRAGRWPCGVAV